MAKKRSHSQDDDDEEEVDDENRENGSDKDDEEDEDEEDHDRRGKKKKKKFKIMSGSGQSEADRRLLRHRQRELKNEILMGAASVGNAAAAGGGSAEDPNSGELMRLRDQNNELWQEVRHTREAVLDSENVDMIVNKAAREADKMVQVPRYDAIRLAQNLATKGSVRTGASSQFNWHGLGFQVGVCFNALPSHVSFLYGPLDAEYTPKERKMPERRKKQTQEEGENEEEEEPDDVDQTGKKKESDGNELSAVEKHISVIKKTLRKRMEVEREAAVERSDEYETQLSQEIDDEQMVQERKQTFVNQNSQVNAVNCLFNPNSFTQTVENVFHFSFLLKEGKAGIKARSAEDVEEYGGEPGPAIRPYENHDMGPPKQAIVSLNMKDWKDMCQAYNVEESDVPHRVDGKVAKKEKKERKSN
mmetsp:Transcript_13521/g.23719  ORF Transcript_13521/g.23719 Transcript_13521/m.23719 type:complete len:417 (-) Transcript_13521:515-1765(-)|eukprot:CAMPEP_0201866960 /NCGR_PEP_ID=MMETSP0902-20130614/1368_1 /ASSEMBLY_ACC=CAM_ASM_000551 /TAXON_ID=420261 /ORGANISM="Thalassiosira antarctica, Strain CCMP982" /LENGTH=416 /DNA_ID=CAMNT_0048392041 /DNA_START=23 /DNA_END=1273 /DNA_ORIENTATION=+